MAAFFDVPVGIGLSTRSQSNSDCESALVGLGERPFAAEVLPYAHRLRKGLLRRKRRTSEWPLPRGCFRAARQFDSSEGVRFQTILSLHMHKRILYDLRGESVHRKPTRLPRHSIRPKVRDAETTPPTGCLSIGATESLEVR